MGNKIGWSEYFYYDETSQSCLRWKIKPSKYSNVLSGNEAGTIKGQFYYRVQLNKKLYTVHRIIWELHYGVIPPDFEIDHVDMNKCNNKISNLRLVSKSVNCRNRPLRKDSNTKINGITRREIRSVSGKPLLYYIVRFLDKNKTRHFKQFSVQRHGEDLARQMAIDFYNTFDGEDNYYTENHGR